MKTLKDLVIEKKIRKGTADGTTKRGAYWSVTGDKWFARLRRTGGDGVGQSEADISYELDLRHFRDGAVRAVICRHSWHQNYGTQKDMIDADAILACTTIEEVVVALKGIDADGEHVYNDTSKLAETLLEFGLPWSAPSPDELREDLANAASE